MNSLVYILNTTTCELSLGTKLEFTVDDTYVIFDADADITNLKSCHLNFTRPQYKYVIIENTKDLVSTIKLITKQNIKDNRELLTLAKKELTLAKETKKCKLSDGSYGYNDLATEENRIKKVKSRLTNLYKINRTLNNHGKYRFTDVSND